MTQHPHNVVRRGRDAAAIYRLQMVSYPLLPARVKDEWLSRLAWLAFRTQADFAIHRVTRFISPDSYRAQAAGAADPRFADRGRWRQLVDRHAERVAVDRPWRTELYLEVALRPPDAIVDGIELPVRARKIATVIQQHRRRMTSRDVRARELEVRAAVSELLPSRPVTGLELQWLYARTQLRGVREPDLDTHWRPPGDIVDADRLRARFAAAVAKERRRVLWVRGDDAATSVVVPQAFLTMGARPHDVPFPGGAEVLFHPFDRLEFPADAVVHVSWVPNPEAVARLTDRVGDADVAYAEATADGRQVVDRRVDDDRDLARRILDELRDPSNPPVLLAAPVIAVGGGDVRDRVERVRRAFGQVPVYWPRSLQARLAENAMPGSVGRHVRDYELPYTTSSFATMMPIASHHAGDRGGVMLGRVLTGSRAPWIVDLAAAPRAGRPPAWLVTGGYGSGKTFLGQLMCVAAALAGGRVVDVDPKPDHGLERVPELSGMVEALELTGAEGDRGSLDPLAVGVAIGREDRANSYYTEVLDQPPLEWRTEIRKAVRDELVERQPCSLRVIERLLASGNDDAVRAGRALEVWADTGIGRLGFGDGGRSRISAAPVTTIRPVGLQMPHALTPRANFTDLQRLSVATLKLVAGFGVEILGGDRSRHKVFLFDEASVFVNTDDGRNLLAQLNLWGRAKNATVVMLAQLAGMVGDLELLVGSRVILGQETEVEARRGLEMLRMDPDDPVLLQEVLSNRKGRGMTLDVHGSLARIQVDAVLPHLLTALDTNPPAVRGDLVAA